MIVTLINKNNINSIILPEKVRGQYWLNDCCDNFAKKIIGIEGLNDEWVMKSNKHIKISAGKGKNLQQKVLEPLSIYSLYDDENSKSYVVFTEPITIDRQEYAKYIVENNTELSIGRNEKNDIVFDNMFASSVHAVISFKNGKWSIQDKNSTNGTFVNKEKITKSNLYIGDVIYIMGLKFVIGKNFIAFNNPDSMVHINTNKIARLTEKRVSQFNDDDCENIEPNYFYRSPRFRRDIEKATFKVDPPPQSPIGEEIPLILVIGPSMTMGLASMTTVIFTISNALTNGGNLSSVIPSIAMSSSMLLGTMLWPVVSKKFEKKRKHKKEALRQEKYKKYLDDISKKIEQECRKQEEILKENYVTVNECIDRIINVKRNLWERSSNQSDFLRLRMGTGNGNLFADVLYSERKFSIEDDNLQEKMYALCEKNKELKDIPITLSLYDNYISGIIGKKELVYEFAKGLIFQLVSLYSYDEVKLVFIYDICDNDLFEFVKWLPHVWSNDNKFRFIATNNNEVKEISAYLEKEIEIRAQLNESDVEAITPYYVVFALNKSLTTRADMIKRIFSLKKNIHFSVITLYDELKELPKECSTVVELVKGKGKIYDKNDISGKTISFIPNASITSNVDALSVKLANIPLDTLVNDFKLPSMVSFLEMYGVGKVEHLNSLTRWKDNDPTKSLEAAVGIDTLGELFKLDLHEKFHGPHGLVAGMTGSGKSEFIITYILSLAVNYHPNEVAFILIDYKGGGMAKSFEKLPHTAGIITNLDGSAIKRSLVSIESELKRRQAIFANASKKIGVSNIDIYKYQKLYREGVVSEPLQHLFIIADEFAELKVQQPDFMIQLVSAARIGRSLGIHLILATQKPSGVVDDQIWSNSKFRVCLKVQERSDSMDMLKRADAAELTDTGRFYLQVGYNELFELGQSAWSGAPYYPSDKVQVEKDSSVMVIDRNGRPIKQARIDKKKLQFTNAKKQLDVITNYLSDIAKEEKIKIKPLWLDPIPPIVILDQLKEKYGTGTSERFVLDPVVGEYDDPVHQQQCLLKISISNEGNMVVYGVAGSGKTTFLNVLIYSMIDEHAPDEVNIYILDFGSGTLRAFSKAPHVGDVVLSYEGEKISNLLKMLYDEIEYRKTLFSDYGGDYESYISNSGATIPSIVIAINNIAAFNENYGEKEDALIYLTREGIKFGIYFVLTALGTGDVRFKLLQNFKQQIVLQLNDTSDYSIVVGKTDGLYPAKYKGRGLIKKDVVYEFQTANLSYDSIPFEFIKNKCLELYGKWRGEAAKKIPILPNKVDVDFLSEYVKTSAKLSVPIGIEKSTLNVHYYPFDSSYIHQIISSTDESSGFVAGLTKLIADKCNLKVTLIDAIHNLDFEPSDNLTFCSTTNECELAVSELFDMVLYRNNTYKDAIANGEDVEDFEKTVVIINSITALMSSLTDKLNEKLSLLLEKGNERYNITIIFAEQSKNISDILFKKWYKQHIPANTGIWIGNGIAEQFHLKPNKVTSEMRKEITSEFGYSVTNGKCIKLKILNTEKDDTQDDE